MNSALLLDDLIDIAQKAAGKQNIQRSDWLATIYQLEKKGATPETVKKVILACIESPYHRPRFFDRGLKYIESNYHVVLSETAKGAGASSGPVRKPFVVQPGWKWMRTRLEAHMHEWDHAFMTKWGRLPERLERSEELSKYCTQDRESSERSNYYCSDCDFGVRPSTGNVA